MSNVGEFADRDPADELSNNAIADSATASEGYSVADTVPDPLNGLADRAKDDPGAPFKPDVLAALMQLCRADRAAFEILRRQLKQAGVRVTAVDDAMAAETGGDERHQSHADLLIEISSDAELFHTCDVAPFADVMIEGHRETWPVRSRGFRRWLTREFYQRHGGAPSAEAVQAALGVIEAKAHYDAPERPIFLRIGEHAGKLYLDLCDPTWRAVEIDCTGWRLVSGPPCRFRRAAGMLALPEPTRGGSIADLRPFLNVATPADDADDADDPPGYVLAVAWLLAAFRATGPYPVLVLAGEQGSAKSTFLLTLRLMIDPNSSALRSLPREDRDLFIAANNCHVLSFDNVSGLPAWISDTLCRLATGGGFAARQLYSDQDEVLFEAMRPCALNGIEDVVSRPDLADRGLFLMLYPIPEERRRAQSELLAEIEAARPAILGALLSAVAHGLRKLPDTQLDRLPRMADFALWATACEGGVGWQAGTFMAAYDGNRRAAIADVIDSDPVAAAVRDLMDDPVTQRDLARRTEWKGTAKSLLEVLRAQVGDAGTKAKTWPASPRGLSGRLRRAATFLRASGIEITFGKREGHDRDRTITITGLENRGKQPSAPSAQQSPPRNPETSCAPDANGDATSTVRTASNHLPTVRGNPLRRNAADDADAKIPAESGASARVVPASDRLVL